jgi:hypothetical protein
MPSNRAHADRPRARPRAEGARAQGRQQANPSGVSARVEPPSVRALDPGDAIELWRLFRHELGITSPLAFMGIARYAASIGVVAERAGEICGLAIARPDARAGVARILALCVASGENGTEVSAALLGGLLERAAFHGIDELEASPVTPNAARLLSAIGAALRHQPEPMLAASGAERPFAVKTGAKRER